MASCVPNHDRFVVRATHFCGSRVTVRVSRATKITGRGLCRRLIGRYSNGVDGRVVDALRCSRTLETKKRMALKVVQLDDLNTRDRLLLVQLIEQYGFDDIELLHSRYTNHPAFQLSHNKLQGTDGQITRQHLQALIDGLLAEYPDKNIIQLCEQFYAQRIEELSQELSRNKELFTATKMAL